MKIEKFKTFLRNSGADILENTDEWMILRFRTKNCPASIIYQKKNGSYTFIGEAKEAYDAMMSKDVWRSMPAGLKKKKRAQKDILERDGAECFFCGIDTTEENRTLEHLLSVAHGGNNDQANLVIACESCNNEVGDMPIIDKVRYREGKRI